MIRNCLILQCECKKILDELQEMALSPYAAHIGMLILELVPGVEFFKQVAPYVDLLNSHELGYGIGKRRAYIGRNQLGNVITDHAGIIGQSPAVHIGPVEITADMYHGILAVRYPIMRLPSRYIYKATRVGMICAAFGANDAFTLGN